VSLKIEITSNRVSSQLKF